MSEKLSEHFRKSHGTFRKNSRNIFQNLSEHFSKSFGTFLKNLRVWSISRFFLLRLLHNGESLCCFRDSALVTYGGMLPSDLPLSALRFILSAKS